MNKIELLAIVLSYVSAVFIGYMGCYIVAEKKKFNKYKKNNPL